MIMSHPLMAVLKSYIKEDAFDFMGDALSKFRLSFIKDNFA